MQEPDKNQRVVVTDLNMPFFSMVVFMVKWAIAAIPALLLLTIIASTAWGILTGTIRLITSDKNVESIATSASDARSVTLSYQYSISGASILFLNFTVHNSNYFTVKDYTVSCKVYGESGTLVSTVSKKVYGNVQPKGEQDFDGFEMGYMDAQAKKVICEVSNVSGV